jgi:hypothetical protein
VWFESRQGLEVFLFTTASRMALGPTQPPIQWVPEAVSLEVKRPGRETDHSPTSRAEIKNAWSYTSIPQYAFVVWCSVKVQGQLYFKNLLLHDGKRACAVLAFMLEREGAPNGSIMLVTIFSPTSP